MKVTNTTGAGAARAPRHHVLPQDIDNFTVELETADHQAQHGGGNWKMARQKWDGEWNKFIMKRLEIAEQNLGHRMSVAEVMQEVERLMKERGIPVRFVPYRGD